MFAALLDHAHFTHKNTYTSTFAVSFLSYIINHLLLNLFHLLIPAIVGKLRENTNISCLRKYNKMSNVHICELLEEISENVKSKDITNIISTWQGSLFEIWWWISSNRGQQRITVRPPTAQTPHSLPLCAYLPAVFYRVHVSEWLLVMWVVIFRTHTWQHNSTMHNHLGIKRRKTEHVFWSILTAIQLLIQLLL